MSMSVPHNYSWTLWVSDILNTLGMTKWSVSPNHFYLSILPLITQITQSFFNQSCLVQDNEVWLYLMFVWWWILLGSCDYNHWNWQVITPARGKNLHEIDVDNIRGKDHLWTEKCDGQTTWRLPILDISVGRASD